MQDHTQHWLVGGGEMGKLVRSLDWSRTALGPIEGWPQSLRTAVGLCLASNFPISLAWGPQHIQIYNDGYWPICGGKHPHSMGQDFSQCWASAWDAVGAAFERALTGETSFLEDQRMFLDRNGYLEETFFTFSFSPIRDETGGIAGLFHPVTETTAKMIGERRTRALRDLSAKAGEAKTSTAALRLAAESLNGFDLDVPFGLFYLVDSNKSTADLAARHGVIPDVLAIERVDLQSSDSQPWPLQQAMQHNATLRVDSVDRLVGGHVCGPYPEAPHTAMVYPIIPPACSTAVAIVVIGVSSRLPLTDAYRAFCDLVAVGVTSALANARAYEEAQQRADALAELDRAKTAFFSNVSHEFRTPLTLMLGPLADELAEVSESLAPERHARLSAAHRNALRLLKLVNSLLDFSRMESDRIRAAFEPIDLSALTAELASVFRSAIEKGGLTLTVDCPELPELVYIDRDLWEKIVLNLLSNAFKHTFSGGIRVSLRWCQDHPELTIVDTGIGIAASELPRLFDRFHRVTGAKSRSHEGTGIGLALVHELVRLHGGSIRVESCEGQGSSFIVTLRSGHEHLTPDRIAAAASHPTGGIRAAAYVEEAMQWLSQPPVDWISADASNLLSVVPEEGTRSCILWADDNADMREYVRRLLGKHYDITAVADGRSAVAAALASPPDLVLTDVMMPGLDGFGVLRELRSHAETRSIPVILLSARAGEEAAVEGMDAGADDYLVKPFTARELVARVRTHLELAKQRRLWEQELQRKATELAAAYKDLESFSYSISHDLRAPLRVIDGFAQMLEEDFPAALGAEGLRLLAAIRGGSTRMGELIVGLLEFSKAGRREINVQETDTLALARSAFAEAKLSHAGMEPTVEISDLPRVEVDSTLFRQVWCNLIGNAIKYSSKQATPKIKISAHVAAGEAIFRVEDNGVGFDMKHAGKLFGVFQRLHRAEEFSGTGVGLAIVHRIVTRHGGRIWADATPGAGACFQFAVPIHQAAAARG